MKHISYARIKKYLRLYNDELGKFFNDLYDRRRKEHKEFDKKFTKATSEIKRVRRTDGLI